MNNDVIIKTNLENPPEELVYCWREPYERFVVGKDGVVEGLSIDHPRFTLLQYEWKLEVVEVTKAAEVTEVVSPAEVAEVAEVVESPQAEKDKEVI